MIGIVALLAVTAAVLPLCVFAGLMGARAARPVAGVGWHLCLAVSWLAGLLLMFACLVALLISLSRSHRIGDTWFFAAVVLTAAVGGSLGPAITYIYFRMRTARDPDYGPLDRAVAGRFADGNQSRARSEAE